MTTYLFSTKTYRTNAEQRAINKKALDHRNGRCPIPGLPELFVTRHGAVWEPYKADGYTGWRALPIESDGWTRRYVIIPSGKHAGERLYLDIAVLGAYGSEVSRERFSKISNPAPLHRNGILSDDFINNLMWVEADELETMYAAIAENKDKKRRRAFLQEYTYATYKSPGKSRKMVFANRHSYGPMYNLIDF